MTTKTTKQWPSHPIRKDVEDLAKLLVWENLSDEKKEEYYQRAVMAKRRSYEDV